MNKITACLVVRNEEKVIEKCLQSIEGVVDEIIVVHDGECLDKTLDICKKYSAKIFVRPFVGAMEAHISFAYKQAGGEWILRIDGDEYLSNDLRKELRELVQSLTIDAYEFLWPIWDGEKSATKNWPYKICLFRKEKISFIGVVHFVTEVVGKTKRLDLILGHQPARNNYTWKIFRKRWLELARIQAETYFHEIKSIDSYNYNEDEWPLKIRFRVKFPLLLAPVEFVMTVYKSLMSGAYREGLFGYKVVLMSGIYRVMVNYFIFKIKCCKKERC